MATLLPVPVEPAMSRWGMPARSAAAMRPLMSLPMATVSFDFEPRNSCDSMFSRSQMISRSRFGTWMPTVLLPGMRSTRMLSARSARQRSSVRPMMRLYLMPASGLNSKVVTTGPGLICVTWPKTSNSAYFAVRTWARSFEFVFVDGLLLVGTMQQARRRQLVTARDFGQVVFALRSVSARS